MKEDKRIGVQGEGSKTPGANVQNSARVDPEWPGDYLSHDELRALFSGMETNIASQAKALRESMSRVEDLEAALQGANDQIARLGEARKLAVLDYFDLVSQLPRDANGSYLGLDDVVEWRGERWRVVAVSHRRHVAVRQEGDDSGKGAKWLDDARQVTFAAGGPREHDAIVSRLLEAGFAPIPEGADKCPCRDREAENRPESAAEPTVEPTADAEFWRQQYGDSQLELMSLLKEHSAALDEIDDLRAKLNEAANAREERDNARDMAVALENECARLTEEARDLGASLHAAERKADRAVAAWDHVMSHTEGVMQLLACVAAPIEYPAKNAIVLLVNELNDGVEGSRKIVGARYASDFERKGAGHDEA